MTAGQIYGHEMIDARNRSRFAGVDMYLGLKGVVGGAILEALQTDYEKAAAQRTLPEAKHYMTEIAAMPVDWKAVALSGAVFAAASGARRASRPYNIGVDFAKTMQRANQAEEFLPHTKSTYDRFRRSRRVKEAVVTAAVTVGAYKLGESLSAETNVMVGVAAGAVGYARVWASKFRYQRLGF